MKRRQKEEKISNPLFLQWLLEWRDEAAKQKREGLKQCLTKAAKSLKEHKEVLQTGRDCLKLKYFGENVCAMLDKRLQQHLLDNGTKRLKDTPKTPNQKTPRTYIPKAGSGAEALLITLYLESKIPGYKGFMTKAELQEEAQPLCDTSLSKAQAGTFYTAWNSMTKLQKEGLVTSWSKPTKFRLSDKGIELAEAIQNAKKNKRNANNATSRADVTVLDTSSSSEDEIVHVRPKPHSLSNFALAKFCDDVEYIPSTSTKQIKTRSPVENHHFTTANFCDNMENIPSTSTNTSPKRNSQKFFFEPYTFDILLLVDNQETSGKAKQKSDPTYTELRSLNTEFEVRHLNIGDFMWIARCRKTKNELVLPHIVERKRIDDFEQSLKDGRYRDQKARLKKSGIKNLIYMIETYAKNQHTNMSYETLLQGSVNTMIRDGFLVKYTDSHKDSMSYLSILTTILRNMYSGKRLICVDKEDLNSINITDNSEPLMEFQKFNKDAAKLKTMKARELFLRQLTQIRGVSADKAVAVLNIFPTPKLLHDALIDPRNNGKELLEPLQWGMHNRQLGPAISKTIYQLYTQRELS